MWGLIKKLFVKEDPEAHHVKNFDEETADLKHKDFRKAGLHSIETEKIVGSVGRAHELDDNFRYRDRRATGRYQRIEASMAQGKPMEPIKVLKVKRDKRETQYFVMDGHHRVSHAKQHHFDEINAEITEVVESPEDGETAEE